MTPVRRVPILCALLASAVLAGGCGGMPGNHVAEVDGEAIDKTSFDHWMRIAEKAGGGSEQQRREQVLQLLVSNEWVQGEAEDLGVKVSDAEVRRNYDRQKEQSFQNDEEFRKFMRDSGQTEQDLLHQVRTQLLTTGISEKVVEGEEGQAQQEQALQRFGEEFQQRWRERTECREEYATSACKNGPDPTPAPTPPQPG